MLRRPSVAYDSWDSLQALGLVVAGHSNAYKSQFIDIGFTVSNCNDFFLFLCRNLLSEPLQRSLIPRAFASAYDMGVVPSLDSHTADSPKDFVAIEPVFRRFSQNLYSLIPVRKPPALLVRIH